MPRKESLCPSCGERMVRSDVAQCRPCYRANYRGRAHHQYKGARYLDRYGYIRVAIGDHPWPRRSEKIQEHIRVMEMHLGRRIRPTEVVHHRDGDKLNNRIENLEVMSRAEHTRLHKTRRQQRAPVLYVASRR